MHGSMIVKFSFVLSVRPSIRMGQLDSYWTDFLGI
jgi:hypothetical protein